MQELESRLKSRDFGLTAEEILTFSRQIAELDQRSTNTERSILMSKYQITRNKWNQLCRIGRDSRLIKYTHTLPSSITALFALTTLSKDELNDGMITGDLHPNISSRKIYSYSRQCRLREKAFSGTENLVPCYIAVGKNGESLNIETFEILLKKVNEILVAHDIMILPSVSSSSKYDDRQKALIAQEQRQGEIETNIEHNMYMESEILSEHYTDEEIDDIMEGSMNDFVRALFMISQTRTQMMKDHGKMYCYKIALEYHRSDNRVQRYNYKRRLIHVQQKYKFLHETIEGIFSEFIEKPRNSCSAI